MKQNSPLFSSATPEQLSKLASKIPDYLKVTSEQIAEIEKDQTELRARFAQHFTKPSPEEHELRYAINYEMMARQFFLAVDAGYSPGDEELSLNKRRLAQALQTQGRYQEAIEAIGEAANEFENTLLQELTDEVIAIHSTPDEEHCSCETPSKIPTTHITKKVRVNGKFIPLVRCTICGHLNATEQLPDGLSHLERARGQNKKLTDEQLFR